MPILATAQQILTQAGQELGLEVGTIGTLQAGQTGDMALALLNALGDDLVRAYDWQFLLKTASLVGDGVTTLFPMPADFGRTVNQTEWSNSMKRPMNGPLTPQQWGWTQYGIVSVGIFYRYRIVGNQFEVFPVPPVGETFNFYYITKNWVNSGVSPGTYIDKVDAGNAVPVFDRRLLISGLKDRLWGQKGFDTSVLKGEFNYNLESEKGQTQGAQAINLSGCLDTFYINPLINITDGGWN